MILNYDVEKLQNLLQSFYVLAKIRIVVFSEDFRKIAEYPDHDCAFCSLIRKDPIAERMCLSSDRKACEHCRKTKQIYSYACHAGLTETVAPIRHSNTVIGYLMFGQILNNDDMQGYWPEVRRLCASYNVDESELKAAFFEKTPIDNAQIYASNQILEACASYLYLSRLIKLQENSLPKQIDEYIISNLSEDLSSSTLCKHFSISRSKLYRIAEEFFGESIGQFVCKVRMQKAQELLINTMLPLGEIAYRVGFIDYNYFIKVFQKNIGKTPLQYRKSINTN